MFSYLILYEYYIISKPLIIIILLIIIKTYFSSQISIEDTDDDDYKLTLKNLWGTDIANYFLNPNFQKTTKIKTITNQSITNQSIPNQSINDNLFIGGYPNGMLHGARIPFHYKLKSWLFDLKQINMNQSIDNRKSIKSIKSMKCPIISHSPIRTNSVFNLIDLLKYHIGTNYSAQYLWNLLRYKSYEQLINYEKQLTNEEQITYSAFTHEYVLKGKEKVNYEGVLFLFFIFLY